ncbi:sn-glycerol-3-phosphate ABC transporter ATP-binding protein UgpC [Comamonas sp. JUb58]|uniref:ABC transporter ATP-binding protein n=1 Tax=Comamonas sp. JUb58 TaxID=2485114 RepID=UPI00105E826C|nr:sn-glycerol-3-phosphate ABC transporter ATP-binding protein UgpC [Comamonas sp. JUb58]TDS70427.1 multiple sugar transport system ATP-binding protein/multiple sugar transport system ATP-binding protein [Comamonas sp. JUb58]
MASVELRDIRKSYGGKVEVIRGVDLSVHEGEFMVFVGPSGCGKSTLLRMLAGLETISSGDVMIGERRVNDVHASKRGVAMVFQSYALYPHMSVYENMSFGLAMSGMKKSEIDSRVQHAAAALQLQPLLQRRPKDLSGGQRQRVAIGRSIVRNPDVFLFDEPLSNLDAALRVQMRIELSKLHKSLKTTMIYVTHDQVEAMTLGDRITVFNAGVVEQVGPPLELYSRPVNRFVATFIGSPSMNILDGVFVLRSDGQHALQLDAGHLIPFGHRSEVVIGSKGAIGMRPEHLVLCASVAQGLSGQVSLVEHLGNESIAYVELESVQQSVAVKLGGTASVKAGDEVGLLPSQIFVFDKDGRTLY